jgi:hypothetical protein
MLNARLFLVALYTAFTMIRAGMKEALAPPIAIAPET